MKFGSELIDLGASVNLIPLTVVQNIDDLKIEPIMTKFQMADKTSRKLVGIIKDFMIKIENFSFPINFTVLDIEEDLKISLKLGRPFMKTTRMIVDNNKGQVKVRFKDHEVCYNFLCII